MVVGDITGEAEFLVIGGGPGGYAAAFRAADLGLDVTLVSDEPRLGGVCLLRGCIPSKALLHLAEVRHDAGAAADMGLSFGDPEVDLERVREWKEDEVVAPLAGGLDRLAERRGVRVERARARFDGPDRVRLEGGDLARIEFEHAVIAAGSRPAALPGTEFGGRVMDSGAALELEEVPERLLVVGGGYIGLEMGTAYSALGSDVTVVEMEDRLMPRADADLAEPLADAVEDRFDDVRLGTAVDALEEVGDGVAVSFGSGPDSGAGGEGEHGSGASDESGSLTPDATFDRVLVAVGRRPNTDDLGLEKAGIDPGDGGFLPVDEQRRTRTDGIYAVGDVTGGAMLAHEAMHEGRVAAEVAAGLPSAFDARAVPAVVYTDPQVAWCGLTEREARERDMDVDVARFPWKASGRALSMGRPEGRTKLLFDPDTERLLGMGVVGPQAEALIAEGALAVEMAAVAEDVAGTVHPHPTLSETVGEAAEVFLGSPVHVGPSGS